VVIISESYKEYIVFARQIGVVGATNILLALQSLILIPILTKNLPIAEYGIWVLITATIALIPPLIMLGLPYTMVRFLAAESSRDDIREGFYSITFVVLGTSLITAIILVIFSEPIASALFNGNTFAVRVLAPIIVFECLITIVINIFRTFQQINRYSLLLILKNLLNLVLVSAFILSDYGINGALVAFLLSDIISLFIIGIFIVKEIGFFIPAFTKIKEYLAFGIPTVPSNLSSWVLKASNRYVIGIFLGASFVGFFNPGVQIANIINMFASPISFLLPAALSKYYDNDQPENVSTLLEYSLKYLLLLAIPAAFGLSILSKPLLTLISTPEIASEGYIVTPIIAFGEIFMCAYIILMQIFVLVKKTMITAKIMISAAVLNLVLNIVLVKYIGITGAALTYFLTFLFVLIMTYSLSKRFIQFNLNLNFIVKYIVASLLMSTLILVFYPETIGEMGLYVSASLIIYVGSLYLLRAVNRDEILFIRNLFHV
jgi:O-antigen/teichoic acid export membrane protein